MLKKMSPIIPNIYFCMIHQITSIERPKKYPPTTKRPIPMIAHGVFQSKNFFLGKCRDPAINGVIHARGHEKRAIKRVIHHFLWNSSLNFSYLLRSMYLLRY